MNQFTLVIGEMSYIFLWDGDPRSWQALLKHLRMLAEDPEEEMDMTIACWISKIILLRAEMKLVEGYFSAGDVLGIIE